MAYVDAETRRRQLLESARNALMRNGIARTSLRVVAAEAGVPLGTLQYVFPTKESLLRAVIEDVVNEIALVLKESLQIEGGLDHAIRNGVRSFWDQLVSGETELQIMQYELTTYALRTAGQEDLARWQYERYCTIVAEWCQDAARMAGQVSAVPYDRLARILVGSVDGLILQYVCDPDPARASGDLDAVLDMAVALTGVTAAGRD